MPTQHTVHFSPAGIRLTGTLHLPDQPPAAAVIGCHGLLADRRSPKQIALAEALNQIGIAYLRFDHRGCGDSQGRILPASLLADRCQDLYHAMRYMQTHSVPGLPIGLFGSSFGGTVAMATAIEHKAAALVTYAAPIDSHGIHKSAEKEVRANNGFSEKEADAFEFDIRPSLGALKTILIMHGENDEIVPVTHSQHIYHAAQGPKRLIHFEKCDHRMSNPLHQGHLIQACVDWFKLNLEGGI